MFTYPTHFHNYIIPKLGFSARRHYTFKKADTLSDPLPTNKGFIKGSKLGLMETKIREMYHSDNDLELNDGDTVSRP